MKTYLIAVAALGAFTPACAIEVNTINAVGVYLAGEIPQRAIDVMQQELRAGRSAAYIGFDVQVTVQHDERQIGPVSIPRRDYGLGDCGHAEALVYFPASVAA